MALKMLYYGSRFCILNQSLGFSKREHSFDISQKLTLQRHYCWLFLLQFLEKLISTLFCVVYLLLY